MLFLNLIILLISVLFTSGVSATISNTSCILPPFPANGRYSLQGKDLVPGDEVSKPAVLHYSCSPDFILSYELSVCQGNDVWTPIPTCTTPCKLFASYTVDYNCYDSKNLGMPCQPDMPHGSSVLFECKTGHTLSRTQTLDEMRCNHGVWSIPLPDCEPDCGLEIADGATFIINAPVAKLDTLPWHVAVYERQPEITFICGGTILSTKIVVSAAHCFYDPIQKRAEPAAHFLVAAHKHFQSWDHPNETDVRKSQITEIRLHEWYTGELHHQQNDIALLVLETPFEFSNTVGAICYDLVNQKFDKYQLSPSSKIKAKFAGWGVTEEERTSEELRVLNVPFIDQRKCIEEYEKYHTERYITADKICAGYTNGSSGCNGDSGAGLVFPYPQGGEIRWWLRGILSVGPRDKFTCRANTYTAFTRVFALRDWIKPHINEILAQREIYQVPESMERSLPDKSLGCPLPEFPSHGKYIILGCHEGGLVPGDSVLPPTHLKYSCDTGYKATAEIFSECRVDQTWSSSPACKEISKNAEEGRGDPNSKGEEGQTWAPDPTTDATEPGYPPGSGCVLPEFPKRGNYTVIAENDDNLKPGDRAPEFTFLIYSCEDGYDLSDDFSVCQENNEWSDTPICTGHCKMVTSTTVDFDCVNRGLSKIPCTDKLPEGTLLMTTCKKGHIEKNYLENLVCKDGKWDSSSSWPSCKPVCGKTSPVLKPPLRERNIISPWHVGIYQREGKFLKQICAGSLIHSNIVITAAHCFWDPIRNQTFPASIYKVAARIADRQLNDQFSWMIVSSEVTKILMHELYGGDELNHEGDVALLELTTPFTLSDSLYPVCYNLYDAYLDAEQTSEGFLAEVFSWGRDNSGKPSRSLKSMAFPIVNITQCQDDYSEYGLERVLTSDKLCGGYTNGSSALCQGDSGAGLVAPTTEFLGEVRWYLFGIVSNGPLSNASSECWSTYTTFTQVFKLRSWISRQLHTLV